MHEAYEVSSLLKLTEQIESIAAYDDNLLVGTRQGHLMMYVVTPNNDNTKFKIQVLRFHKTFSKKPIQQIEVIQGHNLLLCLTDNILLLHDLNIIHFPIAQTFNETKGGTLFALDNKTTTSLTDDQVSIIRLAVAVKRKIQLYYWKHTEFKSLCPDISVPDIPKAMVWGQDVICVGFKDEYILYNLAGDTRGQYLTSSSRSIDPCIIKLSDTSFMLARDQASVIIKESTPTVPSESVMKVNEPLISGAYDEPYALGLISDQVVVHTIDPPMFVQTLSDLNRARLLYKCRRGLLYVASMSQIWRIGAVDITTQRQTLLKDKQFQLALKLTHMSDEPEEEKKQKTDSIRMLYAFDLFDNKNFSESMAIFLELETDPSEVIKLFPELNSNDAELDPSAADKTRKADRENSILALIEYLRVVRQRVQKNLSKIAEAPGNDAAKDAAIKQNNQLLELIDTTLLKCYLQTNDAFVGPLLRLNNCKLDEAEEVLMNHKKYSELIILYQTNNQHAKALQFMKDQANMSDSSLRGCERTKNYLQNLGADHINLIFEFSSWVLRENPEEGLKIFTDDILEVENLPRAKVLDFLLREHKSLVIPYLEHIVHVWEDNGAIYHNALVRILRERATDESGTYSEFERQNFRTKLSTFLQKSNHYSPELVLVHFPVDSLFEERAIALGKVDSHELALCIYVHILDDIQRAIDYCDAASKKQDKKSQDVYVTLIRILVDPSREALLSGLVWKRKTPGPRSPDVETALRLLDEHADKIDPVKALAVLPDEVPFSRLERFLEIAIRKRLANRRRLQVLKGLLYAELLRVQELNMVHRSQSVTVADYDVCPVCKKRFGGRSAFVRYPNGDIVHYSCRDK